MANEVNRIIFEHDIETMKKYGPDSILRKRIYPKRESLRKTMLEYYESTEEYEKCSFINEFFQQLESPEKDKLIEEEYKRILYKKVLNR